LVFAVVLVGDILIIKISTRGTNEVFGFGMESMWLLR